MDPVEAVGDVNLGDVDGAIARVGLDYGLDDPLEGPPKLHGLLWSQAQGVGIDSKEGIVTDGARSAVTLGDHTQWAQPEGRFRGQEVGREDCPVAFVDHIGELLSQKGTVVSG